MFDAQCDLAALVYEAEQDPDTLLRDFSDELKAQGFKAAGLVQLGHHCVDSRLSARLVHSGEEVSLLQDLGPCATGCRLDVGRLLDAGVRIEGAIAAGADLLIINRFGRQERDGKGLTYLIERALDADMPVVIAVSDRSFADWIRFAGGMSVKLACEHDALAAWWRSVSRRGHAAIVRDHASVCEVLK